MKLKGVTWRNIFSYGNSPKRLDFSSLKGIIQIVGKNGAGKSSIAKIIKIGAYQELEGIPVKEVANDINGEGYIGVEYNDGNKDIFIESEYGRGGLDSLKVSVNGKQEDTGKIPDTKIWLKNNTNSVPFHIFNNLINLSIGNSKSFLDMSADDSRKIRDRLFSFQAINDIYGNVNKRVLEMNSTLENAKTELESLNTSLVEVQTSYQNTLNEQKEQKTQKLEELKKQIDEKLIEISNKEIFLEQVTGEFTDCTLMLQTIVNEEIEAEIEKLTKEKEEYDRYIDKIKEANTTHSEKIQNLNESLKYYERLKGHSDYTFQKSLNETKSRELEVVKGAIEKDNEKIVKLRETIADYTATNIFINELTEDIATLHLITTKENLLEGTQSNIDLVKKELEVIESNITNGQKKLNEKTNALENCTRLLDVYKSGKCGTCESDLTTGTSLTKLAELEEESATISASIEKIDKILTESKNLKNKAKEDLARHEKDSLDLNKKISSLKAQISTKWSSNVNELEEKLEEHKKHLEEIGYDSSMELEITLLEHTVEANRKKEKELSVEISSSASLMKKFEEFKDFEVDNNIMSENAIAIEINTIKGKVSKNEERMLESVSERSRLQTEITNLTSKLTEHDRVETKLTKEELQNSIKENLQLKEETSNELIRLQQDIDNLKAQSNELSGENSEKLLKNFKESLEKINSRITEIKLQNSEKLDELLKFSLYQKTLTDQGIKSYIIKNYVPQINLIIQQILGEQDLNIRCQFDQNFSAILTRNSKQISVKSISTGQAKMIDTAIIIAVTKLLMLKYPTINFVFYDEVFSSLHSDNINITLNLIKKHLVEQMGLTVFLVNHSYVSSSYFSKIIVAENKNGFSGISILDPQEYESQESKQLKDELVS